MALTSTKQAITGLFDGIREKAGVEGPMTFPQALSAVEGIETGGGLSEADMLLMGVIPSVSPSVAESVRVIGSNALRNCKALAKAEFPHVTSIGSSAFYGCTALAVAIFPETTVIEGNAFNGCITLSTASFPKATSIGNYAFQSCTMLRSLYLLGSSVPTLVSNSAFNSTPLYNYSLYNWGNIYVRASLYSSFITAANWSDVSISARIVPLTDAQIAALE